jgi:hypothetical protein
MASAADVPHKFDVVINGEGYRFADVEQRRAVYTYSPTFIQRTNVEGDYGDNQQDFWLTWGQRDWSLGDQLKFYRNDARRFWAGTNVDVTIPGQAKIRSAMRSVTFAAAVRACTSKGIQSGSIYAAATANLYEIDEAGTISDRGAHGLGVVPGYFGVTTDGRDLYLSSAAGGTAGVRKWNGAAFSTFSAAGADSLEYLNNALYGMKLSTSELVRWDSAGTQSVLFQWKRVDGTARGGNIGKLEAFGGQLAILWSDVFRAPELWLYDGSAPALAHVFPPNFYAYDMEVLHGTIFISGSFMKGDAASVMVRPAIFFYQSGQIGRLWQANGYMTSSGALGSVSTNHPALIAFDGLMVWNDDTTGSLVAYDPAVGGTHTIGSYTVAGSTGLLAASTKTLLHTRNQAAAYQFPDTTTIASSAEITHSLVDFDSSLDKYFKAVKIDADIPTGSTIDISYRLADVDGAYTSVQTGAASGTEYTIGASGRAISIKITLNKGSSSTGPTLKRVYLRAAPILQTFRRREYVLDLSGRNGESHIALRDGTLHPEDGLAMATDLNTATTATTPFSITDRFGTFTGIIEADSFSLIEIRPEEFVATVRVREV